MSSATYKVYYVTRIGGGALWVYFLLVFLGSSRRSGLTGAPVSPLRKDSEAPPLDLHKRLGFGAHGRVRVSIRKQDQALPAHLDRQALKK